MQGRLRNELRNLGTQGPEPMGRWNMALGSRGVQAAFKPTRAITQAKASASAKTFAAASLAASFVVSTDGH